MLEPAMTARIDIRFDLAADPCWVEIDSGQFESALLNLALNARDAMVQGGVLTIGVSAVGDRFVVSVKDTGAGMGAEVRARAFEPFFTTKDVGKGSGLGLSMVYGFVRQSGGSIAIDSAPGRGTAVTMSFRRAEAPTGDAPVQVEPAPLDFGNLRILLVEDDVMVRETVGAMIRDLGATIVAAKDGPTAVDLLKSGEAPDIMLTDIVMPGGMDGIALSKVAMDLRPEARIVFMSGNAELDQRTLHAIQEQPFLAKPFRKLQLAAALCEARAQQRRAPVENPPSAPTRSVA